MRVSGAPFVREDANVTYLPVPELTDTLQRYLETVRPFLTDEEFARTTEVVEDFEANDGPKAQEALLRRADEQNEAGASWLTELWLATYLGGRTPLPLTSNVGFQLAWNEDDSGIERAARLAHRLARVHLDHIRGEIEPLMSPRGQMLCMRQWSYTAGGIRRPHDGQDEIVPGSDDPADREIIVLHRGQAHAVQISDADGAVVSQGALREALHRIVAAADDGSADEQPFAAWSYLGSDDAARYEAEALSDEHNAAVYERLVQAVFLFTLTDEPADAVEHLRATAFDYGHAWPNKPVTYSASLVDDYVGMHIEHTVADGGTLTAVIARAQELDDEGEAERAGSDSNDLRLDRLTWRLPEEVSQRLAADVQRYRDAAAAYRIRVVRAPAITSEAMRLSADALQQFVMAFAQLRTYGQVRGTYESVDMREFQAGRTEALRPVSRQAVALAEAMVAGRATPELLQEALDEHKRRVIACKTGNGIDRHLLGLRIMSTELGLSPELFSDVAYQRLTTDFLSTTSLGDDLQIPRYVFAPTSQGGIGVGYARHDDGTVFEYLLDYTDARADDIGDFADALEEGTAVLGEVVAAAV